MLSAPPLGELLNICAGMPPDTGSIGGKVDPSVQHPAGRLGPVVVEDRLHLRHHRAAHPEMGVAPVVGVLGVATPLVGDADAAGVADPAVDHQDLCDASGC